MNDTPTDAMIAELEAQRAILGTRCANFAAELSQMRQANVGLSEALERAQGEIRRLAGVLDKMVAEETADQGEAAE